MENFTGPILPNSSYTYVSDTKFMEIVIGFIPLWFVLGCVTLYGIVEFINCCLCSGCGFFKKNNKKRKCTTEVKYKIRNKECDICVDSCTCTHKIYDI